MKIALYQNATQGSPSQQLEQLAVQAAQAASQQARLLIVPEMYLTGYNIGAEAIKQLAEPANGASAQYIANLARQYQIAILYGYPERVGNAVYNAAQLIDRDGQTLLNHRKTHLFGDIDRSAFHAGATLSVAVLDDWRLGVLICYDIEFPENARLLALQDVDFIAVPTALMQPYHFIARSLVTARAYENQVFLAYVNRCDQEDELHYLGQSCVIAPDGSELVRAGTDAALIFAELDRKRQQQSRRMNTYLLDRRPALYARLSEHTEDKQS